MSYKAIITDLDGTAIKLSSNGDEISEETINLVKKAQAINTKIACATGRQWLLTKEVVQKLGIVDACIVEGGTRIVDPNTEKTIWEKHLDQQSLDATLDIFKRESDSGELLTANTESRPLETVDSIEVDARIMYLLGVNSIVSDNICNIINAQGFAVAHATPSWNGEGLLDIHVTHPEATKEHALAEWHRIENVSKEATIAMGDSENDIPLFQSAGLKVAVSNATDSLKSLADYIAPNENEQALGHVISKFILRNK